MSKEEKGHEPRRSASRLRIPESSASSADHAPTPTRRRTKFNTAGANLRKTVGPEYHLVSDFQPSVSAADHDEPASKPPKDPTSFLPTFSFLRLNPFSFFTSFGAKGKADAETPSTSTATTTGKQKTVISWAKTTKVLYTDTSTVESSRSSRSSRGSTSSLSSRGSVSSVTEAEVPPSDKAKPKKSIAAARKSIVLAKKSLASGTPRVEPKRPISVRTNVTVQKEKAEKPPKVEYAPQLSSRRHNKSRSFLPSIHRKGGSKVHPTTSTIPAAKLKRSKKPSRHSDLKKVPSVFSATSAASAAAATYLTDEDESVLLSAKGSSEQVTIGTKSQSHTALTVESNLKAEDPKQGPQENPTEPESRYKMWRKKLGFRSDVIRLRNSLNGQSYKFSAMSSGAGGNRRMTRKSIAFTAEDPLQENNIQRAADYKGWIKSAHMALPSKIGVPVEETNDVLRAGMDAVDRTEGFDPRDAYNNLLGSMQNHVYRKSMSAGKSHSGERRRSSDAQKRLSTLKLIPEHLATKRDYKKRLVSDGEGEAAVGAKERKSWKHKAGLHFSIFHNIFRDVLFYCSIWRSTIREIHGRFGITTAVYFKCIRSILILNLAYFLIIFVFLVIPEIVIDLRHPREYNSEPSAGCYTKLEGKCKKFSPKINKRLGFSVKDLITGEGSLENTYLYFSGFRDNTAQDLCPLKPEADLDEQYEDPLGITAFRFILVSFLLFVINSVYISFRIVNYYHAAGLQTKVPGMAKKDLFRMLLCAWDFSCTDPEGAKALHKSIRRELRELSGGLAKEKADALNTATKDQTVNFFVSKYGRNVWQIIVHWLLNAAVALACGIAGTIIYFAYYSRILWANIQSSDKCDTFTPPPTLLLVAPALFISVTSELMTLFCSWCSNFEKWTTAERKNFTMFGRIGLYYIANIVAIYGYAVSYSDFLHKKTDKKTDSHLVYSLCYEEKIGEEIYRVVVIHGVIHYLASWVRILYYWIRKKINPKFSKRPIFDPTYHALDIFFVHTICGFGYLYCPLISLIFIIRLIIIFYNNKLILYKYSSLPEHLSYVSEISAPYFVTFFMTYFITTVLNVYTFVELDSSFTCGPFTHFHVKVSSGRSAKGHYYNVLEEVLTSVTSSSISKFAKPGIIWVFIFFLVYGGLIYTFKAWADGYALTLENLHELLVYEKKDRDFLLQAIFSVVREQNNADDDFDDYDTDVTGTPEEKGPRRTTAWQESSLATGIFEFQRKSVGAVVQGRKSMYNDSTVFVNASDNLDGTAPRPKKSFVPQTYQDLPSHSSRKKVSVADVWIKAYFDVRKARRHSRTSDDLTNLEKLYGQGQTRL